MTGKDWAYYNQKLDEEVAQARKKSKELGPKAQAKLWFQTFRLLSIGMGVVCFVLWLLAIIFWYTKFMSLGFLFLIPVIGFAILAVWQFDKYETLPDDPEADLK